MDYEAMDFHTNKIKTPGNPEREMLSGVVMCCQPFAQLRRIKKWG
jgi:hypothetical protein